MKKSLKYDSGIDFEGMGENMKIGDDEEDLKEKEYSKENMLPLEKEWKE